MHLVATTPLAFALCLLVLVLGPLRGLGCLFAAIPFGGAAAVNLTGLGTVSLTDAVICALWLSLIFHRVPLAGVLAPLAPRAPGFPLLLLVILAAIGAVFLPRLLAGQTEVFVIARVNDAAVVALAPLSPQGSNISQLVRLVIDGSACILLAAALALSGAQDRVHAALVVATSIHAALSILDLASYAAGRPELLDIIRTARMNFLDAQSIAGIKRLSGGFPEPSSYAYLTLGLFGYWLRLWFAARRPRFTGLFLLVVTLLLLRSTSSAAYAGLALFLAIFATRRVSRRARDGRATRLVAIIVALVPAALGVAMLLYATQPYMAEIADRVLVDKLSSRSGQERMSWNTQALTNFLETGGLGAGIGSVRASGWVFAVLGNLGAIGAGLFVWFLWRVFRTGPADSDSDRPARVAALKWACVALLIPACLTKSYPNLEAVFFALAGLAVGLSVHRPSTRRFVRGPAPVFSHARAI